MMNSQGSMSSISLLMLTSKISSVTSVMVEGSRKSENKGRGWTDPTSPHMRIKYVP